MRSVTDGRIELNNEVRNHLELCLDCRACETACPSGVQYGKLIEPFRIAMEQHTDQPPKSEDWFHRWILFGLFPYANRMRAALWPARIAQMTGAYAATKFALRMAPWIAPPRLRQLVVMLPWLGAPQPALPELLPAKGKRRARVALFTGCVGDSVFRRTNWATARVLQENGCDVIVPRTQQCCGAIHFHAGSSEPARRMADANVQAFDISGIDAVVVNVAGCGAMLKDYGHHWHDAVHPTDDAQRAREALAHKIKDVNQFLDQLGLIAPRGEVNYTATYHDACHLAHAQKVKDAPRNLLSQVPGLKLVDLPETELCCGAAGTYNLTQPEMSQRLSKRKLENIKSTGASLCITANAGCLLQILREANEQGYALRVRHPMDVLDASYRSAKI
jgi:glycolate oxidase iron-sulfur subunit